MEFMTHYFKKKWDKKNIGRIPVSWVFF